VAICTIVLFFAAPRLLSYFPTVLAAVMVLFLGTQLLMEAVWESSKELMWNEWATAVATLIACNFLGFAPGVGIGLGTVAVVGFCLRLAESVSRGNKTATDFLTKNSQQRQSVIQPCDTDPSLSERTAVGFAKRISRFVRNVSPACLPFSDPDSHKTGEQGWTGTHPSLGLTSFPQIIKLGRRPKFELVAFGESAKT
jgi:MFS superfamily sulfate permease-like transporter